MMGPTPTPTSTRPIARVFVAFKNKTYASLKPLTCSILICLTIVLLPDSPAPETGGENRRSLISPSRFCLILPRIPRRLREICARVRITYIRIFRRPRNRDFANRDIIDRPRDNVIGASRVHTSSNASFLRSIYKFAPIEISPETNRELLFK